MIFLTFIYSHGLILSQTKSSKNHAIISPSSPILFSQKNQKNKILIIILKASWSILPSQLAAKFHIFQKYLSKKLLKEEY